MKIEMKLLVLVWLTIACAGCAGIQDAIVRTMHMDRDYRSTVFPLLFDRYQQKMERSQPFPRKLLPIEVPSADQG